MKYSQDYAFQRSPSDIGLKGKHNDHHCKDESFIEVRIKSLEQKVESLEKQLKLYEQMYNIKNYSYSHSKLICDFDEEPIKELNRRIAQLEEYYSKENVNNYQLTRVDIDKMINEKFTQDQIKTNLKLSDIALKIKDLSQYNERQQMRYANFQDSLIHFDKYLTENSTKIKDLNLQIVSLKELFNDNSKEEELFLRNISNNNTNRDDLHF